MPDAGVIKPGDGKENERKKINAALTSLSTAETSITALEGYQAVVKTADEARTADATPSDDDHLTFTVAANTTYVFELDLIVTGGGAGDITLTWNKPASSTARTTELANASTTTGSITLQTTAAQTFYKIMMKLTVGATAGACTMQWSQAVSDATASRIYKGSCMRKISETV